MCLKHRVVIRQVCLNAEIKLTTSPEYQFWALKVPRVTSVQSTQSIRVSGLNFYNETALSFRNSRSYQTFMLKC